MKLAGLIAGIALSASSIANATLITNGDFENPGITSGWTYGVDSTAGGWQGDEIEVWASGFKGVDSYEGTQHGELNSHPYDNSSFSIYQSFDTRANAVYDVSLAYRARKTDKEAFRLEIFTGELASRTHLIDMIFDDHTTSAWSSYAGDFIGTGSETYLMLTSVKPATKTVGNFIDSVRVTEVPEPATLALMGLGLVGLALTRRRIKKA